jgi:hypothetical protein
MIPANLGLEPRVERRIALAKLMRNLEILAACVPKIDAFDVHQAKQFGYRARHVAARLVAGATALRDPDRGPELALVQSQALSQAAWFDRNSHENSSKVRDMTFG